MTNPNPTPADEPCKRCGGDKKVCAKCGKRWGPRHFWYCSAVSIFSKEITKPCPDCADEPTGDNANTERYIERLEKLFVMRRKHITTQRDRIKEDAKQIELIEKQCQENGKSAADKALEIATLRTRIEELETEAVGNLGRNTRLAIEKNKLQARIEELEGENENYTLVMLRIDNYCRVNDIDITEAVKGE